MTVSEIRLNETVPAFLKRIAEATEKIAAEMEKANKLTAITVAGRIEGSNLPSNVRKDRIVALGQIMGVDMQIPDQPDGSKEGAE